MANKKHFPKIISNWEFDCGLFTNLPRIIVYSNFSPISFKLKRGTLPLLTKQASKLENYLSYRGLTSPHRCCVTSFSHLNQVSQSGQNTFFYFMFSVTFKALVMFATFLQFQSNLDVVLASAKCPKISVFIEIFLIKTTPRTPAASSMPHGAWISLQPNWFSQMPQKHHPPKISSSYPVMSS